MVLDGDVERPHRHQLPRHATPGQLGKVLADAEGGQLVVRELRDLVGDLAAQDIDQMRHAEAPPGAQHRAQQLLRRHRAVEQLRRVAADVAGAAIPSRPRPRRSSAAGCAGGRSPPRRSRRSPPAGRARSASARRSPGSRRCGGGPGRCRRRRTAAGRGPAARRARRGRSPGTSSPAISAGQGARPSGRPAGRCPCRRRWSPP